LTLPRLPDKIGSASPNFGHERTHESIRAYTPVLRFYAATTATASTTAAVYATASFTAASWLNRRCSRFCASETAHLHAAAESACAEKPVAMDPRRLRMLDADHHHYRDHLDVDLPGEATGERIQD
jgi:hypothetical protein